MPYIRFPLQIVSPTINKGTDPKADLRAPSVIGQIRFWLRAMLGAQYVSSEEVYRRESSILGSTSVASSVTMQIRKREIQTGNVHVLPHSGQKKFREDSVLEGSAFDLKLILRPGTTFPVELSQAISLWLLLGGLGKRSRRMFGSVQLQSRPRMSKGFDPSPETYPDWWKNWEAIQQRPHLYARLVSMAVKAAIPQDKIGTVRKSEPDFPILHPDWCRIIVANKGFPSAEAANIALFEILRKDQFRRDEYMFGSGKPRRASPLIAQGRYFNDAYYPVITAFRSPIKRYPKWDVMDAALDAIADAFDGEQLLAKRLNR